MLCAMRERGAAETTAFLRQRVIRHTVARRRGIRGDHAVDAVCEQRLDNARDVVIGEIRRKLHQQRTCLPARLLELAAYTVQLRKQPVENLGFL
jgi:hypothetical protein